ncbi:MAG: hypothetical protein IJ949_03450, partial [Oscillospiraceae bacterium]|nr:hypothetical protein [Oscillospiraceae bacterium]
MSTLYTIVLDGENYTGEYSVEYSVHEEDAGIVTIDKDGNITALSEGTARIIAKVTTPEGEDTAEKTLTVTAAPTLASISAEAGNVNLIPGEETDITVEAGMNDGLPGNISGYVCEYESSDTDVITVDGNGHITAVGTGTASVIASVQNESGKTLFATVSMTVTEPATEIVLNFNQSTVASNTDTNGGARAAQVASGVNWQIVPERSTVGTMSAYSTLARISAYVEGGSSEGFAKNWLQAVGDIKNRGMFTVKTKITEGAYRVKLICSLINIAGMAGVYVDGQYVGIYDGYDTEPTKYASAPAGEEKVMGDVYITPDEDGYAEISFVLAATSDGKTPGDGRNEASDILLTKLTLTPVGKMPEVAEIEIDMDNFGILSEGEEITLPKNAEVDFTARVKMTDGTYKELNGYKVDFYANPRTATEDPDNAITAAASGDAVTYAQISNFKDSYAMYETGGQFGGKITSVENGAAQLTVTAKVSGKPYIKTVNITVSDKAIAKTTGYAETKTLFVGDSVRLLADGELEDGSIIADAFTTNVFSSDSDCVLIDNVSGRITALKVGTATVKVETTYNGITVDDYFEIEILPEGMTEIKLSAGGSQHIRLSGIENEIVPLYVTAISNIGRELDLANAEITAVSENPEVATIDSALNITPVSEGEVNLTVTVKLNGRERTVTAPLTVSRAKSGSTYYTKEKLDAVRENVKRYDWAKQTMETN